MKSVTKDVLYAGTWRLADGTKFTATPADLRNAVEQGNRMLAEGIPAPWCWEHDLTAYPVKLSENAWFARGYFGKTLGYSLGKTEYGECVEMRGECFDAQDADQFERVAKVSPMVVRDYTDDTGKVWPGLTICHVAATPKPIQRKQNPPRIEPAAVALSAKNRGRSYCLGQLTREKDMPNEVPKPNPKDGADSGDPDAKDKTNESSPGDEVTIDKELLDLFAQAGWMLGDGVRDVEDLKGRMKAGIAMGLTMQKPQDDSMTASAGGDQIGAASSGPMIMSDLSPALQKAVSGIVEGNRAKLLDRVETLFKTGRIDPKRRADLTNQVKAVALSLNHDGTLTETKLQIVIETLEAQPANSVWSPKDQGGHKLSDFHAPPAPEELNGVDEKKRLDAYTTSMEERMKARGHGVKK